MEGIKNKKILIFGSDAKGALEVSYFNAFKEIGCDVSFFEYISKENRFVKGRKFGKILHSFLPVEQWTRKMNREFVVYVKNSQPDFIFYFTNARILTGTIACIKTMLPQTKHILVWPDTPLNIKSHVFDSGPLYDYTAMYSSAAVPVFKQLGFSNVHWIPLASDPKMFTVTDTSNVCKIDIGFVGGWRPEREAVMVKLFENFPQLHFEIHGPLWGKVCKHTGLKKCIKSEGLYEEELANFFATTRMNINVIDDTNYPAANMRFFEIGVSKGLQLTSACPEMESLLQDKKEILYFNDDASLVSQVQWILDNPQTATEVAYNGHLEILKSHTYKNRVLEILNFFQK